MKHTPRVIIALVSFFFIAQFTGLLVINHYIDHKKTIETKAVAWQPLPYNLERPEVKNQSASFIYITMALLIGTLLLLLIIKTQTTFLWKIIFFIAITTTLSIAFAAFLHTFVAGVLALSISIWRLYKPNIVIHNISEIFIYGGLAASVVEIFNLFAVFMLLIIISVYDFIAVYKTKHMIRLAKFQSKSRVFAGLFIPYEKGELAVKEKETTKAGLKKARVAVLGGGDIGFTLIFSGVVMGGLMLKETVLVGFLKALIIPFIVSIALLMLLVKGQQNKFYPAMPVLSLGCFVGYFIVCTGGNPFLIFECLRNIFSPVIDYISNAIAQI